MLLLLLMVTHLIEPLSAQGAPVPVRFAEGMVRGFLELSDADGKRIASGDFLQVPRGGELKCRTVLYFKDGSLHDESAVFTQERDFLMKSYRLIQKGKAFEQEMDISLERSGSGKYRVAVGKAGNEKVLEGKLDLPLDVYNGMVPTVLKNLPKGAREKIHMVAFTPAPRVIELEMAPDGEDRVLVGDLEKSADHYVLKPKLGLLRLPAALLGRTPPDNHIWTITKEVPAFVRFVGPLAFGGPVWRIELASPRWPK
ncbi:hypothetical protein GPEL0_01f0008 [Geoanaerobacter pelophilus]|uniref:DUF3108 domain-containing protein n=1 Tax=Geoanaerobacter pelophilus TaxID=60036 RepID=A0ABQ0MDN6_9BACT|nr:hypothetical protein GPEL0_01f0008 [Geoanaerobacter pelophilus]